MNQTSQMHQISEHLPEYEHSFSPYYCDGPAEILRRRTREGLFVRQGHHELDALRARSGEERVHVRAAQRTLRRGSDGGEIGEL